MPDDFSEFLKMREQHPEAAKVVKELIVSFPYPKKASQDFNDKLARSFEAMFWTGCKIGFDHGYDAGYDALINNTN